MDYYNEIKNKLIDNEITKKVKNYSVNKSELETYYQVGKMLSEAGHHYGEGIIKNYSAKLIMEVNKKYNTTNLKRYRQFYLMIEKGAPLGHQLTWSHYRELIPIKNINKIRYYIYLCEKQNLTRDNLKEKIKSKEYDRLPKITKDKLIYNNKVEIKDFIKNPILIKNTTKYNNISERILQKLILEDIPSFLKELGEGFTFIDNEYKIKTDTGYNYIDLLLFNIKYNCYVVVELKVTELKKEHIGQIEVYINYIDKKIKDILHNKTIGIIITKKGNKFVIDYCTDSRIFDTTYELV